MSEEKRREIIIELRAIFPEEVILTETLPVAYCTDISNVKAIVLGCDPSNLHSTDLEFAFGIGNKEQKLKMFFSGIEYNLKEIGLSKDEVYVQNLCQNYFTHVTSKNSIWPDAAELWIPYLVDELSIFNTSVPVLLTSSYLYNVLKLGRKFPPSYYYECKEPVPIPAEHSKLNRPMIPFYRNRRKTDYHLSSGNWPEYQNRLKEIIHGKLRNHF